MSTGTLSFAGAATGFFLAASSAWAQHDPSRLEDLLSDHPSEYRARAGMTMYAEEPVRGQTTDFALLEEDFSASALLWKDDVEDLRLSAGVRHQGIRTGAILPDTGIPFPDDLWNVNVGLTYRYLFESGLVLGGSVGVGSASDDPFHSSREIVESVMIFLKVPSGDRDAWLFALAYSNNREYANSYPIPMIEYFYNPSPEFRLMVGFPMEFVEWRPLPDLSLRLLYSLVHNIHALAAYEIADPLRIYAGFDWNTQGYLLLDRPDSADRFFYDEKRVKGGFRLILGEGWTFDLSSGYAFGRKYSQSDHGLRNSFDRVDIGSGLYGMATLEWKLGHARDRRPGRSDVP
ncbi:MAG TPA: hypothetical protein VKW04_04055 [Planctomycetota bacterium]|nr:hypothetical protein [Planctomycetota bacterium]